MSDDEIPLHDVLRLLAFMGDLSMGQPVDHSTRVARLAGYLAEKLGIESDSIDDIRQIALLRWAGCTANASDVAEVIQDDVDGRAAMLALQLEKIELLAPLESLQQKITTTTAIHCEVSSVIASTLGLRPAITASLDCIFEAWDGTGGPNGLRGESIPLPVLLVAIAGDLEIFTRVYGLSAAQELLMQRADSIYPRHLVTVVCTHAEQWLADLAKDAEQPGKPRVSDDKKLSLSLVADVIDLKLPWLTGHSRAVAQHAASTAAQLNLSSETQAKIKCAGLLHGLGRVTVPNIVWNQQRTLTPAQWERVRLSPYWTARSISQIRDLSEVAEISSYAFERLDGSGYFRASRQNATPLEYRILPVVTAWLALCARRPWRTAFSTDNAMKHLLHEAELGRFDKRVVAKVASSMVLPTTSNINTKSQLLSTREIDVLRSIGRGNSNKETALILGISPATVRTHVENLFRKLACNSRAAATLKAASLGLI